MGEVWLATDTVLARPVALKLLLRETVRDEAARARFLREGRAIAALNHPNIAVVYEAAEHEGVPYLAMEYVDGHALSHELRTGPLAQARLADYALQAAAALEHAHSRGIVHRDVKPSNILVNSQGTIKLVDFGLAKAFATDAETETTVTIPGTFVGTLHYAAPEVLNGRAVDARSDLYSLGVVLYEMACGVVPFAGIEGLAFVSAVLRGDAPPLRQRNPAVSPALAAVVSQAMAVRPEDRFRTAAELRAALSAMDPAASAQPVQAASGALAVLEFENLSHDPSMDWLGTGIAETLTADLTKLKLLQIVSSERIHRAAAQQTGGRDAAALGDALRVRWVVTGSFQRAGNRVRITPRLLDVSRGQALATGKVDGSWEDIFELQDRHLKLGNQGEKGRLLKLHREPLLQRVVKYAVTGLVVEIGEDDRVFVGQDGRTVSEIPEAYDCEHRGGRARGNDPLPPLGCGSSACVLARSRGGAARIGIALQPLEIGAHVDGSLIAQLAILLQRLVDDAFQIFRQVRIDAHGRGRHLVQDRVKCRCGCGSAEGEHAGRHFVEHDTRGEEVRARIELLAERLLGGHV
jgi:TolB-like protein/tRNA A-37 threonylcarbamoyl transferase component Bud32